MDISTARKMAMQFSLLNKERLTEIAQSPDVSMSFTSLLYLNIEQLKKPFFKNGL